MQCLSPSVPPALAVKPHLLRQLLLTLLGIALVLGCGYAGYRLSEAIGIRELAAGGERQLELNARAVESEIGKYTYLPSLLELESGVSRLLLTPGSYRRQRLNDHLEGLNQRAGSLAVYVLDLDGRVVATSNWNQPSSFLGEDLSFRDYYKQAVRGEPGRFYGVGSTTGEPGYYLAHGLRANGRVIGVAVVKVRLDALEKRWADARVEAYVSDENGIIILSSDPARRLKAVQPLGDADRERLARSLQYHWATLQELRPLASRGLGDGLQEVRLDGPAGQPLDYLQQTRALNDTAWHLTLLTPLAEQRRAAASHGLLAGVVCALLIFGGLALNQRRKVIATRLAAREALQRANSELERKIAERTLDLSASNLLLQAEVRERQQTEANLRQAQDGLVQAGKLAVIGQMSTSVAHELNQPLAALRTLSANAARFLERGALDTAGSNLQAIGELVDRMGRITGSLRAFARRSGGHGQASLEQAVEAALFLLHSRVEQERPTLHREFAEARLAIDQTRLEQILVNLLSNALDALREQPRRELWLSGAQHGASYRLEVRDSGAGIPPDVRVHLFEPFFTTKPGEKGLGLGLTLSASLAAAAGGSLVVRHPEEGGSAFILDLPLQEPRDD